MRIKGKFTIGVLIAGLMLGGLFGTASPAFPGIKPSVANAAWPVLSVKTPELRNAADQRLAAVESQRDLARENMLYEINLYLSGMDTADLAASLRLFRVMNLLKLKYPGNISDAALLSGAIKGTVNALNDPYSLYMDPETYKNFTVETTGSFSGAGIVLGAKEKVLTVIAPIEGTPGEKAGIMSGDQILKIDGRDTKDMSIDDAVHLVRGPEGTKVILTVSRTGEAVKDYTIIRANVQIKTVTGKMLENGIGYIRISMFNEHSGENLQKKLQELESQGLRAVILDVRNNPGGLIEEGVNVTGQFVPKGPVVSYETKDGIKVTYFSYLSAPKYPLVVLVNGGSASASEILAGAVQDTGAGTLIGTKTFGKGSVQNVMPFEDASALKLTVAKWFTPKGRPIDGVGVEPDIKVEMPDNKENAKDVQLDAAVNLLKSKLK